MVAFTVRMFTSLGHKLLETAKNAITVYYILEAFQNGQMYSSLRKLSGVERVICCWWMDERAVYESWLAGGWWGFLEFSCSFIQLLADRTSTFNKSFE